MDTVTLLPEDVPGAILNPDIAIEDNAVLQLKRWLECRGLKRTGSKQELIERIKNCIDNGGINKIFLGVDQGKWYDLKRNIYPLQTSTRSNIVEVEENLVWARFPSRPLPEYFNKGHIYTYLCNENVENDDPVVVEVQGGKQIMTGKPFIRGNQFVDSDYISEVYDSLNNNVYNCKCQCQASFEKNVKYKVSVSINKTSGAVVKGTCQCKQSALGKCSHVTALLIFVAKYIEEHGNIPTASTSKPREWGKGSSKRNPTHIFIDYPIKRYKPSQRATYNPLPPVYQRHINVNNFLQNLEMSPELTMFQTIFNMRYEDFTYTGEENEIIKVQTQLFLQNMKEKFPLNNDIHQIAGTFPQLSSEWKRWRTYFITASNAKLVCGLSTESAKKNYLLKNLWLATKPVNTVAMQYGKKNEAVARTEYKQLFLKNGETLKELGLAVNSKFLYLACSIDGLVMNANLEIDHLIEIKCPKVLEQCTNLSEFDKFLTKKQLNNFFLVKTNNTISIRQHHPYLYQMLVSMLVYSVECCKLIVWAPKGMLIISIFKNNYLLQIEEIKQKVKNFYENIYIPEMFTMRCVRDLNPINFKNI